ncbi:DNA polymerase III subunit delta' [Pseudoxanthobacter sp.]|uniref:DNA polymerase III subunit delta' n=1 Tax=Pseudoxanthobacter sp. TaxID=1925742 RepID=UPI002FDFAD56
MARAARRSDTPREDGSPGDPDALEGVPAPRAQTALFGHREAEATLLEAYRSGRLHHGWILGGPRGIGKATLALRFARFVLANPDPSAPAVQAARDLSVDPACAAARLVAGGAHPDLLHLQRPWDDKARRFRTEITVDEVRRLVPFFGSTAGAGGYRVALVDAADDLNTNAANALLKMLEEPPSKGLFLLVSHAPGRLLATIRSRARRQLLRPLADGDVAAALAAFGPGGDRAALEHAVATCEGSVRRAVTALNGGGLDLEAALAPVLGQLGAPDPRAVNALADLVSAREAGEAWDLALDRLRAFMAAVVRQGAEAGAPAIALNVWAEVWDRLEATVARTEGFNLDRRQAMLAIVRDMSAAARAAAG